MGVVSYWLGGWPVVLAAPIVKLSFVMSPRKIKKREKEKVGYGDVSFERILLSTTVVQYPMLDAVPILPILPSEPVKHKLLDFSILNLDSLLLTIPFTAA